MVQESLFGKLAMQLANLMSTPDLHTNSYILATVLHTNSYITFGWPVNRATRGGESKEL